MYPSRADLVSQSAVSELLALTSAQQDALYDMAKIAVEGFTGQTFLPFEGVEIYDGGGGSDLALRRRIERLDAVAIHGTSLDKSSVTFTEDGTRLSIAPRSGNYAVRAMQDEWGDTRTFRRGSGTVRLEGLFGWSSPPAAVAQAMRLDMEDQARADASQLSGITSAARRLGLRDVRQGNIALTIGDPSAVSPHVARLLSNYKWPVQGGILV